jgi:6-carboxyhexanoate--CoA ligase
MTESMNSLRMRAERNGDHISGAERLLAAEELTAAAVAMLQRALQHPRGRVDRISIRVEEIPAEDIRAGSLPDLYNNEVQTWRQGRDLAREILRSSGVSRRAIEAAISALAGGAAPSGKSMRGAMLVDADTGQRLESDQARGVRASRMDLTAAARRQLCSALEGFGLNKPQVVEALTLAAKVLSAPGVVAELCWSDDPGYLAGYVAGQQIGYQRINLLKPAGEERGGRAFFVNCSMTRLPTLVKWLERQPLLIERIGRIHPPRSWQGEP